MTIQYDLIHREMSNVEMSLKIFRKPMIIFTEPFLKPNRSPLSREREELEAVNRYEALEGYNNSNLVIETASRLDKIRKKVYVQSKSYDELIKLAGIRKYAKVSSGHHFRFLIRI